MNWNQVKESHPNQWVVVEALEAHTTPDSIRHIESVSIIDVADDGADAMTKYRKLHLKNPSREYYFLHTKMDSLDIEEHKWLGVRVK